MRGAVAAALCLLGLGPASAQTVYVTRIGRVIEGGDERLGILLIGMSFLRHIDMRRTVTPDADAIPCSRGRSL